MSEALVWTTWGWSSGKFSENLWNKHRIILQKDWVAVAFFTRLYPWSSWLFCIKYIVSTSVEGNGNPLQCSCLENPRDGGAWWAAVYGVAQSRTRLKWLSSTSIRTEEPGRLQSMGSLGVRHDWVTSFSLFTIMHWRRKWQPTPVFLPGESQGRGSLVSCRLWGRTESDRTEAT